MCGIVVLDLDLKGSRLGGREMARSVPEGVEDYIISPHNTERCSTSLARAENGVDKM